MTVDHMNRVCPLMSGAAPVVYELPGIVIASEGKAAQAIATGAREQDVKVVSMMIPCVGPKCMFWHDEKGDCRINYGLYSLGVLSKSVVVTGEAVSSFLGLIHEHTAHLEPPKSGPSPMGRIAAALEKLVADIAQSRSKKLTGDK